MIALASDHAGYEYKERIKKLLDEMGLPYEDFGTHTPESTDYPDYGHAASDAIASHRADRGILVCGSGIGMSMVSNKHSGVRAAMCESTEAARLARQHNDANVLTIGARLTPWSKAVEIIKVFLSTQFEGGRHQRRVEKIHKLTKL